MFSVKSTFVLVTLLYYFAASIYAGDILFTRCDTNLAEYSIGRLNVIDNDGPDLCNLTGCTVVADHSYNITADICFNLPSAVPISILYYDLVGVLTLTDGAFPALTFNIQAESGDLCNKIHTTSPTSSCPISLLTASPTTPKCATFALKIPAPYLRQALSCLPLPDVSRSGVLIARIWKNVHGTNAEAGICMNSAATYRLS